MITQLAVARWRPGTAALALVPALWLMQATAADKQETPRVAAAFWGGGGTPEEVRAVARFPFVFAGLPGGNARARAYVASLREANPHILLATYTVAVEYWAKVNPADNIKSRTYEAIELNDWWVRDAQGQRQKWTSQYGTDLVNITHWAPSDADGRRYPQWLAENEKKSLSGVSGLDYIFVDNLWYSPRPRGGAMDWKRNGTNQENSDSIIQSAFRKGNAEFVGALRAAFPSVKIIGNADNDLDYPEFRGLLEGAFIECAMGKSWSYETVKGWEYMMNIYRKALSNTIGPKDVMLQACSTNGIDLRLMRYGLTSALLENGWFSYAVNGVRPPYYADEFGAPLGRAIEGPPSSATKSGVWMRRYSNGLVIVNPQNTEVTVNIGPGYRRLSGQQDKKTNNGRAEEHVSVPGRDGLVLLRVPPVTAGRKE